jgi:hypothetical protein
LEIKLLHSKCSQVLSCDTDIFHGETPAKLNHYLETANVAQMQNWIHNWKPFILFSIQEAEELSWQGVSLLTTYFPMSDGPRRPQHNRPHRTARPCLRPRRTLPRLSYRAHSLRSFFVGVITRTPTL